MKDNLSMIKRKDTVITDGLMEESSRDGGMKESNMVLEPIKLLKVAIKNMDYGN